LLLLPEAGYGSQSATQTPVSSAGCAAPPEWSWEPPKACGGADSGVRSCALRSGLRCLLEALVKAGPDLFGGQLCPLPLLSGDDDTGGRNTCDAGKTENLPEVHDQETLL